MSLRTGLTAFFPRGPPGPPGPPGTPCPPLSNVLYVDGGTATPLVSQDGAICSPYKKIGQALVDAGTRPVGSSVTISVTPGLYDEDLLVPGSRIIVINGLGNVELGTGAPARNVTWVNGPPFGVLSIEFVHITGSAFLSDGGSGAFGEFAFLGGEDINGTLDGTAYTGPLSIDLSGGVAPGSGNVGVLNAPTATLTSFDKRSIMGATTIDKYDRIVGLNFGGNVTVNTGPVSPVSAFFRATFSAGGLSYTSPGVFRLDGVTQYFVEAVDLALLGGTTLDRIDDPQPRVVTLALLPFVIDFPTRIVIVAAALPGSVFLPNTATVTPKVGDTCTVKAPAGASAGTPLTVDGNGNTIDGAATLDIATSYGSISFVWNGLEWSAI